MGVSCHKENKEKKENKDNQDNQDKLKLNENLEVPYIPFEIIEIFKNDYKFMKELLEYKRDPTLALLKLSNAVFVYDENFNLKIEKNFINLGGSSDYVGIPLSQAVKREWCIFFENLKKDYAKILTEEELNLLKNKCNKNLRIYYEIDEKFLGPIIEKVLDEIYQSFIKIFSFKTDIPRKQNDYINIDLKNKTDINNIRYYWLFQGVMLTQNTLKYNESMKDNSFKVEINGKPKFQIVAFYLNILDDFMKNGESNIKETIDIIDDKIIEQNLKYLDF